MSGFKVEFSVLNLKATPGIYADALASRPAAGYPGRVFIDTDNPSTGMYRDTGTVWVQIAETATSDVDTLQNVTDNGNTTTNSISVGHANTPVSTIDVRQSTSGLNNASNWTITANNNPTIASGATFGTNYVNAIYGAQTQLFLQNATIGNSGLNTAGLFINTLQSNAPGSPGIITVTQASTIRAISGTQTGIFYGGTNVGVTYSHVAALKTFQPINTGSAATVTNNYGIIVADSTPSSGTVTYTNRWGIYQEGASDKNYFAANVLIQSTTDNGNALQVTGNGNITGNLLVATTSPSYNAAGRGNITIGGSSTSVLAFQTGGVAKGYVFHSGLYMSLWNEANGYIEFGTNNAERMRITSGGNVLVGTTSASTTGVYGTPQISVESNAFASSQIMSHSNTSGNFSILGIGKSRGTGAAPTIVADGEVVGAIYFFGYDGASYRPTSAITSIVNGTPGTADMPGALIFNTTADGASSISERARITSSGELLINTTTDVGDFKLQVSGNAYVSGTIGINSTSPNAASLLQIDSTTKGFLLPRMTDAQITAISNPPDGLMVYSTDQNHIAFWNAAAGVWKKVSNSNL